MRPGGLDVDEIEAIAVAQVEGAEEGARGDQVLDGVVGERDALEVDDLEDGEGVAAGGEGLGEADADAADGEAREVRVARGRRSLKMKPRAPWAKSTWRSATEQAAA